MLAPNFYLTLLTGAISPNGPAVWVSCLVSRWHEFLQVCSGAGLYFSLPIYRVGKNRDTRRESPAAAGAACAAGHKTVLFSQRILVAQKAIAYTALLAAGLFIHLSYIT